MTMAEVFREIQYETEKRKLIKINNDIDSLIDLAHNLYMNTESEEEKAALDKKIKAYWDIKNIAENMLKISRK